jgi:adenylate cyclase
MADATSDAVTTEQWRAILTGSDPGLRRLRAFWGRLPGTPRCKVCAAPFRGPGRIATMAIMHGRAPGNPLLCGMCMHGLRKRPGGAEVEGTVLFADVRGSTGIAEGRSAREFRGLLQTFYEICSSAVDRHGGIVDKFMGDGTMALFLPVTAGQAHARQALGAARAILARVARSPLAAGGVGVGCGVHTGAMFVGTTGTGDRLDFSALGDTVNVAARLGALAGAGEVLAGRAAWEASGEDGLRPEVRRITVAGRSAPLEVVRLAVGERADG